MLYRLSISPWHDHFLREGAPSFDLWFEQSQTMTFIHLPP